jgi:hypothetical protein
MELDCITELQDWTSQLIEAVDTDNEDGDVRCDTARTVVALRGACESIREHTDLALLDFAAAGRRPFSGLWSDTVARRFAATSQAGSVNVLVGRMLVPGGPWPGHFGLEAAVFSTQPTMMPSWYPPVPVGGGMLTFAESIALSAAFRRGHGSVIFPEFLAVSEPPNVQSFGVILVDRLVGLYIEHVLPVARTLEWLTPGEDSRTPELRELAFHAHEWGHRAVDSKYSENVTGHRPRLLAALSEVAADIAALNMLIRASHWLAPSVAKTLVLDRVLREAWFPRAETRVSGVVARQLLQFLARGKIIRQTSQGLELDLEFASVAIASELKIVNDVYRAANGGDARAIDNYFRNYGWSVQDGRASLQDPEPIIAAVEACVGSMTKTS